MPGQVDVDRERVFFFVNFSNRHACSRREKAAPKGGWCRFFWRYDCGAETASVPDASAGSDGQVTGTAVVTTLRRACWYFFQRISSAASAGSGLSTTSGSVAFVSTPI